jgi:Glycosyl transferase family 2
MPLGARVAGLRARASEVNSVTQPLLSVVVVSYNMARELPRTILSLSASYQRDIGEDDYEIVLIDNGSNDFVPDHYSRMARNLRALRSPIVTQSPVHAIQCGLDAARGSLVGVMIDGARLASPGLLHRARQASMLHPRTIIGTLGFHLGPKVQMKSIFEGYDQREEDRLLESINWPNDPDRLFEISSFAGASAAGWFCPMSESNAFFMHKTLWDELGGFDLRFQSPGGGLVNPDTWTRACELPDTELITLLGEATFHQIHGGVATNAVDPPLRQFHHEYRQIRGRPFIKTNRKSLFFGGIPNSALASVEWSAKHADGNRT